MSAKEIIEQIKALPVGERRVVDEFVISTAAETPPARDAADFEKLVDRVFDRHADLMHRLAQ